MTTTMQRTLSSLRKLSRLKQGPRIILREVVQILTIAPTNGIFLSSLKNCFLARDAKPEKQRVRN